jgi:hypothetical protein
MGQNIAKLPRQGSSQELSSLANKYQADYNRRAVSVELRARACLNPLDQATTAFCNALRMLLCVTLGGIGFFPGTTHIGVVELHNLRHHAPLSDDASITARPDKTR